MLKLKHIFLTLSLIELTVGLSDARPNTFFYLSLPAGAILFGLFLITQVLDKESALYDEQQRDPNLSPNPSQVRQQPSSVRQEVAYDPVLTAAHSH